MSLFIEGLDWMHSQHMETVVCIEVVNLSADRVYIIEFTILVILKVENREPEPRDTLALSEMW